MQITIKNRFSGEAIYTTDAKSLREAVEKAGSDSVSLSGAVLRYADLRHADLSDADLSCADLSDADLRGAVLRRADLRRADLSRANLDFACWPLWCGSIGVIIDERIAKQRMFHALVDALHIIPEGAVTQAMIDWANEFHRVGEVKPLSLEKKEEAA